MSRQLQILIVDDETQMLHAMESAIARLGHSVIKANNGKEALEILENLKVDLVISDMKMPIITGEELLIEVRRRYPQMPFVLITAYGTIQQAVDAMKYGAFDFITKPFSAESLEQVIAKLGRAPGSSRKTSPKRESSDNSRSIVTRDPGFSKLLEMAETIAPSDASVLIQGESGTGKELLARLIHRSSDRRDAPFIAVNCAALPDNLLESELFGHEKGAFTGAQNSKPGKFELANGGTILLDEISEMNPLLQAKLLRVLQEREVDRVGGQRPIAIDVRVIATTNRNMTESVQKGDFREDLYYRLNVIPLFVPSLRERGGDIRLLLEHFVRKYSNGSKQLNQGTIETLERHPWPGNIRELQNACQRAVLLAKEDSLDADCFLLGSTAQARVEGPSQGKLEIRSGLSVAEAERMLIIETLKATEDNRTKAAELLGISIRTLRNKLNEYKGAELCH